jgi:hypothetical protein
LPSGPPGSWPVVAAELRVHAAVAEQHRAAEEPCVGAQ